MNREKDNLTGVASVQEGFAFVGGEPCLDFLNTETSWRRNAWSDLLTSFESLVKWEKQGDLLSQKEADRLCLLGVRRKRKASLILRDALSLRQTARTAIYALAHGRPVPTEILRTINHYWTRSAHHRRLVTKDDVLQVVWDAAGEDTMDKPLWPIVESLVRVLIESPHDRIKQCARDSCEWFFLDTSKNGGRRWCQMSVCGNREKVHRFSKKPLTDAEQMD